MGWTETAVRRRGLEVVQGPSGGLATILGSPPPQKLPALGERYGMMALRRADGAIESVRAPRRRVDDQDGPQRRTSI
jgi:hypothetical protein